MAKVPPAPPPDDDGGKPGRKRRPARSLAGRPGRTYSPDAGAAVPLGGMLGSLRFNKPLFRPWLDTPVMLRDPAVKLGLGMIVGQMFGAKRTVNAADPEVKGFVENTYKKFWREVMPVCAYHALAWGYGPAIHHTDHDADGHWKYAGGQWVNPPDATPHRDATGADWGKLTGFRLSAGVRHGEDSPFVPVPHAFWFAGLGELGQFHGEPRLVAAFDTWLEKHGREGGGLQSRKDYFALNAFRGMVIFHPPGYRDPNDPSLGTNRDYALRMADVAKNGTVFVVPDTRRPGDGQTENTWRVEPIQQNAAPGVNMLEYIPALDKEILAGLGVPAEVVMAGETGSGFSGRSVPRDQFYATIDRLVAAVIAAFDPVCRALVTANYGEDAEYTVEAVPLADAQQQQGGQGGQQAPAGAGTDASLAGTGGGAPAGPGGGGPGGGAAGQGGGGDPTGGGLVPYVGSHGGHGKKNPVTGRVTYLSHDGATRLGCLLAEVPAAYADACRRFAAGIPDKELATDGRETEPHCTIRHGLRGLDPTPIHAAVSELGTLAFHPGQLRVFKNPEADVLYVSCGNENDWQRWHRSLDHLPNEKTHDSYTPHLTLAYLKPGRGKDYLGRDDLAGPPQPIDRIVYGGPDGADHPARVWPSAAELEAMLGKAVASV